MQTPITGTSGAAIGQYLLVKDNGSGKEIVTTANTDIVTGCTQATGATAADEAFAKHLPNGSLVRLKAGGTIAKNARLMPAASGEVVALAGSGRYSVGQALEAAVDGDVFWVMFQVTHTPTA